MKNKNSGSPHSSMMDDTSRHSCDELMMTRSLYEAETSDTASQVCSNVRWVMEFLNQGYKNSFITLKRNISSSFILVNKEGFICRLDVNDVQCHISGEGQYCQE